MKLKVSAISSAPTAEMDVRTPKSGKTMSDDSITVSSQETPWTKTCHTQESQEMTIVLNTQGGNQDQPEDTRVHVRAHQRTFQEGRVVDVRSHSRQMKHGARGARTLK
eukprot:1881406-Amphidinium_carterae.6